MPARDSTGVRRPAEAGGASIMDPPLRRAAALPVRIPRGILAGRATVEAIRRPARVSAAGTSTRAAPRAALPARVLATAIPLRVRASAEIPSIRDRAEAFRHRDLRLRAGTRDLAAGRGATRRRAVPVDLRDRFPAEVQAEAVRPAAAVTPPVAAAIRPVAAIPADADRWIIAESTYSFPSIGVPA